MLRTIVAMVTCVGIIIVPYAKYVYADCFGVRTIDPYHIPCICEENDCVFPAAEMGWGFDYCDSLLSGELGGRTECYDSLEIVGTMTFCTVTVDSGVMAGLVFGYAACGSAWFLCTGGPVPCAAVLISCLAGLAVPVIVPDCWLLRCSTDFVTMQSMYDWEATGLGGTPCVGQ